jgi:SAM-dependent methyltransferase
MYVGYALVFPNRRSQPKKLGLTMNGETAPTSSLKTFIKSIPLIGPTAGKLAHLPFVARVRRLAFPGSASFWESVYRHGGTSGPGSYGRLAQFKAEVLNDFVRTRNVRTVVEFGCGDGAQLSLAKYPEYVGVDVSPVAVRRCSLLFASDRSKRFFLIGALPADLGTFDLVLSLDVIYHLVEDRVFEEYMSRLFSFSLRYVVIYASNYDAWTEAHHVRHRNFTAWIDKKAPKWRAAGFIANPFPADPLQPDETSFADFHFFIRKDALSD